MTSLEPPAEVYYRHFDQIEGDFLSYGSQHPENIAFRKELARKAKSKSFEILPLHQIVTVRDETIDPKKVAPNELFSYLGLGDIESGTGNIIEYQKLIGNDILSKSSVFYKGDIVFGRLRPYLNKVHLVKKEKAIGSSELYVITPNHDKVNPEFLLRYLISELTLTQTKWILTGSSYPRLGIDDFLNLSIIVPDIKSGIQDNIVKEVSELVSEAILNSRKASLLAEAAYTLIPEKLSIIVPMNTNHQYYALPIDQMQDRLDFNFNMKQYRELSEEISKTSHSFTFGELIDEEKGFTNGLEIRSFYDEGSPYLRVGDVKHNKLNLDEVARVDAKLSDLTKNIKLEYGNLIISRSGTPGLVLLVDETYPIDELILSSHLIRVVLKEKINGKSINPHFVTYFLRSNIGQMQFTQISNGTTVPEVNQGFLSGMKIVIPDERVQTNILGLVDAKVKEAEKYEKIAEHKWTESRKKFIDLLF